MPVAAYYPQLDLVKIDADGVRIPLPSETVDVYNVTQATSAGTLASDADGVIVQGFIGAAVGDVIELSHASYPLTQRLTLAATQQEAYGFNPVAYLVENLIPGESLAKRVDIYAYDLDSTNPPYIIGSGARNSTAEIPFSAGSIDKNLRLFAASVTEKDSLSHTYFDQLPFEDITIPAQLVDAADITGTLPVAHGGTGDTGTAWSTWTPTITAFTGTITTKSGAGRYKTIGKTVIFSVKITITTNGTGGTKVICTLPVASVNSGANQTAFGMENQVTGTSIAGAILNNSSTMYLTTYNNGYPGGNGYVLEISGVYESA